MDSLTLAKDQYIAELGGLTITSHGETHAPQFPQPDGWQAIEATPGLFMRLVSATADCDIFTTRGAAGTHAVEVSVPQAAQLTVLAGCILWQQASDGFRPRELGPGQSVQMLPYEPHTYYFLADCVNAVVLTPPLSAPHPEQNPYL